MRVAVVWMAVMRLGVLADVLRRHVLQCVLQCLPRYVLRNELQCVLPWRAWYGVATVSRID